MSTTKKFLVFVYGTLKRNEPNYHVIDPAKHTCPESTGVSRFVGSARTVNKFPLVIGTRFNIPFLLDRQSLGHNIRGEVYEVDEKVLSKLDVLEDYPNFYDREVQPMKLDDGDSSISCWVYLIRKFPDRLLSQPLLEEYRNTPEKKYMERCDRDPAVVAKNDLEYSAE